MILEATHTHLYRGHRGKISGLARLAELQSGRDCLVEFSDGTAAAARISKFGDDWRLSTDAYRTAAGTDIANKRWIVRLRETGDRIEFRIVDGA
jgi:hypothetical protein